MLRALLRLENADLERPPRFWVVAGCPETNELLFWRYFGGAGAGRLSACSREYFQECSEERSPEGSPKHSPERF